MTGSSAAEADGKPCRPKNIVCCAGCAPDTLLKAEGKRKSDGNRREFRGVPWPANGGLRLCRQENGNFAEFQLTAKGGIVIRRPCLQSLVTQARDCRGKSGIGGVPEWLKGTGCKPVGYAYVGSNPTSSTTGRLSWNSLDMRAERQKRSGVVLAGVLGLVSSEVGPSALTCCRAGVAQW